MEYKKEDWMLRLESVSFLILVNRHTNEYINVYSDNNDYLASLVELLDKHPNMK